MTPRPIRRRNRVCPELLRRMGIEPAEVRQVDPLVALYLAGVKLSYAASLKKDLKLLLRWLNEPGYTVVQLHPAQPLGLAA